MAKTPSNPSRFHLARHYAQAGCLVVPLHGSKRQRCSCGKPDCTAPGRHPRAKGGLADATTDPKVIERWWDKWPDARIGIATGALGKLIALETRGNRGQRSMREMKAEYGALPSTVTIRAGDRRLRLFKVDDQAARSTDIADGVRVIGDGDVVVAPSTLDSTGRRYFLESRRPGDVEIARCPDWLWTLIPGRLPEVAKPSASATPAVECSAPPAIAPEATPGAKAAPLNEPRRRGRPKKVQAQSAALTESTTVSESTASANLDIPPFLDRRPLSPDEERLLNDFKSFLDSGLFRTPWNSTSAVLQHRVVDLLRAMIRG
jgi:hypothetical protein